MSEEEPKVDWSDSKYRTRPGSGKDDQFHWDGLAERKILIQTCSSCGKLRHPPSPACPWCQSLDWTTTEAGGTGTVYSYTIYHHPPLPGMKIPYLVALIELDEGVRIVSNIPDTPFEDVQIGSRVEVFYIELPGDGQVLHQFRLIG